MDPYIGIHVGLLPEGDHGTIGLEHVVVPIRELEF